MLKWLKRYFKQTKVRTLIKAGNYPKGIMVGGGESE